MRISNLIAKIENGVIAAGAAVKNRAAPVASDIKHSVASARLDYKARRLVRREAEEAAIRARAAELLSK